MAKIDRRTLLTAGLGGAAAALAAPVRLLAATGRRQQSTVSASDRLNLGVIGVGSRGQHMMRRFLRVPGVRITALCDVYEPRFGAGRAIVGEETATYRDYRRMLDEASDVDAVLVATPLSFHADHVIAALESGRHVYGEKAMGFTVADCDAIRAAANGSTPLFQIGHQYRYAPWYRKAVEMIRGEEIGEVTHIYAYWHRNYNWRRPVPDPSLERLINWRLYREYSGGLLAELGSHHIDVANWIFAAAPETVTGTGGIAFYDDGRETWDNVQALYSYPGGRRLFFSSIIGNHRMGFQIQVFGTGGSIELGLADGTVYYEPGRPNSAVPEERLEGGIPTSASLSVEGDKPYTGPGAPIEVEADEMIDEDLLACRSFVDCIRHGQRPLADENVGWASATAVALGNRAIDSRQPVDFEQALG